MSTPRVVRVLSNNKQQLQIILFRSRQQSSVRIPYLGAAAPNVETNSDLLISEFSQSAPLPPLSVPSHCLQVRCFKGIGMQIII